MNPDSLDNGETIDHRLERGKGRGELSPGTMLGQYRILRLLGRGGMGEVYEVEHEVLRRRYALKLIPDELVSQRGFLERFKREAQVTAHLDHPHIVKVDDFGETEEIFWLRMELVEGIGAKGEKITTLAELAETGGGKIEQGLLARVLGQVLEGLNYAHGKGAVHRDLKPANILLSGNDLASIEAKISDFGLVRLVGEEWVRSRAEQSVSLSMSLGDKETEPGADKSGTSTRSLLGTYEYMSPEQKRGEEADACSDLYAVGLMIHRLLTGQRELSYDLPSQIDNNLVRDWDEVVRRALRPVREERFSSAGEMLESLSKVKKALDVRLEEKQRQEEARQKAEEKRRHQAEEERWKEEERRRQEAEQLRLEEKRRQKETEELRKNAEALRIKKEKTPAGMAFIPAGEFMMGSPSSEKGRSNDEGPVHKVYLDDFYMDKYEITVEQYNKFINISGYRKPGNWSRQLRYKKRPVVNVSWNDAVAYAKWSGKRLPTEAEWEKAARGGLKGKKYPWGDNVDKSKANYSARGTKPVGSYPANGYGLYDMAGNVWEWVADWYDSGYYKKTSPYKNPKGLGSGQYRVLRGGSWDSSAYGMRVAVRSRGLPVSRLTYDGFRCARRAGGFSKPEARTP